MPIQLLHSHTVCRPALYFQSQVLSFCAIFRKRRGWEARVLNLGYRAQFSQLDLSSIVLSSNPRPRLKDSQLVRFLPHDNLNHVMFHLYCLFHKSPIRVKTIKYLYSHILPFLTVCYLSPGALPRALISFLKSLPSLKLRDYIVYLRSPSTVKGPFNLGYSFRMSDFWGLGAQPGRVRYHGLPLSSHDSVKFKMS